MESLTREMLEMRNASKAIGLYPESQFERARAVATRRIREFVLEGDGTHGEMLPWLDEPTPIPERER